MMASAKLVRDCSSELSSDVRSLSVASSTEEQDSTTTESEYTEEEKEYELEDLQILKTIGKWYWYDTTYVLFANNTRIFFKESREMLSHFTYDEIR